MRFLKFLVIVFFVVVIVTIPSRKDAFAGCLLDAYYKFDRWATNFDPFGSALRPLNEVPGLKVSGLLYNWTFINTHGDRQISNVKKDWRFQQIQWLGQIHTRYQLAPRAELVTNFHFMYDGVYDWQHSSLYADRINKDSEYSHTGEQIIREFHLDMELGNWFLKLGKQQVVWGKMEGRWMDFINNLNGKDGSQIRAAFYRELRIPMWMANATYTFGKSSLQFLWILDFEPEQSPLPGSPWWSPLRPDPELDPLYRGPADEPGVSSKNQEWAMRYDTKLGRVTWSLGYMYGFSPTPTNFITQDGGQFYYDSRYTRRHFIGSSVDFGYTITGVPAIKRIPLVYRAEVVYKTNQYFRDSDKWDGVSSLIDRGVSDTDIISGAMQFYLYFPKRICGYYQPMISYYSGWKESLGVNRWSLGHLFFIMKTWESFEDRLITYYYTFLLTGGPRNKWGGMKNNFIVEWKFSDYMRMKLQYIDYHGGDSDPYGQFDLWDNFGWELTYNF